MEAILLHPLVLSGSIASISPALSEMLQHANFFPFSQNLGYTQLQGSLPYCVSNLNGGGGEKICLHFSILCVAAKVASKLQTKNQQSEVHLETAAQIWAPALSVCTAPLGKSA